MERLVLIGFRSHDRAVSEGVVVGETRVDWISGIASVPANMLGLVKSATACHAAAEILSYSLSQMQLDTGTIMMNKNIKEFNRNMKALDSLDVTDIRSVQT